MIGNIIENQFKGNARNWPFGAALGTALLLGFGLVYGLVNRRLRDETSARPVLRTGL
jgi:spermidine/putrescine transport system permease protein